MEIETENKKIQDNALIIALVLCIFPDAWQARYLGPAGAASGPHDDPDGDGLDNLLELASGSSPSDRSSGYDNLRYIGTFAGGLRTVYPGLPLSRKEFRPTGVDHRALFTRRRDFAAAGLRYLPQFSTDLSVWTDGAAPLQVLADDGIYQTVSIAYPVSPAGTDRWFFRVTLELTAPP